MIDLRKEIEKLKNRGGWTNDTFYHTAINDVEVTLNQYNIITAPKTIKLSEIVSRLNDNNYKKFEVVKMNTHFLIENTNFYRQYFELKDNKVSNISEEMQIDEFKWLYTLWIAGAIVEDDLKEE